MGRVRGALALFAEVCDAAKLSEGSDARWWTVPTEVRVGRMADVTLLSLDEAETALADLEAAQLLTPAERGYRIEADALCECPVLATMDVEAGKARIRGAGKLVSPTTALLREIVRTADEEGVAATTMPRLVEAVLYGRTRVTQSLAVLEHLSLVERSNLPNRAVRLRLVNGTPSPAPPADRRASAAARTQAGSRMRLPTGVPLQVSGEPLVLAPGIVPELELDADGRYYLWLGPVRLGPYDG